MKEKKFHRWLLTWTAVILIVYVVVSQVMNLFMDHVFEDQLLNLTGEYMYSEDSDSFRADRYEIRVSDPEMVNVKSLEMKNRRVYLIMEPAGAKSGRVNVDIYDKESDTFIDSAILEVSKSGLIVDRVYGNFTHCRERQFCIMAAVIALTLLLWIGYFKSIRELRFSYHSIFCIGLGIWGVTVSIPMIYQYLQINIMLNYYSALAAAGDRLVVFSFPFTLIFAVLLSISNISLIRHEGFRPRNALGIALSFVMVFGAIFLTLMGDIYSSGYELYVNLWTAFTRIFTTIYAVLECFLIGAIICGSRAARNHPAYDKDYIVILGCMIRSDGTLYPLIRGRVDRAIRFYQDQLNATGKKAVFVPSGGQGPDEPISEAAAMKNYLLQQGIPEEQILPEDQSKNTRQNMQFSKELIGDDAKAVFSTTNFHVFRSGIIAGQVGFETDGMGSPTKWYFWPNAYIREVIGMLSYKWKTLVVLFLPIAAFLATITLFF